MDIFSRCKYIGTEQFPNLINILATSFEALREEFMFGSLSQLKKEGIDVSRISRDIVPDSELDDMLKGFQLTCMMGIAWDYIKNAKAQLDFDILLSSQLKAQEGSRSWNYRNKYIDCQGSIESLSKTLARDVHRAIGYPEPNREFLIQFQGGAQILIGLCQAETCSACGDPKKATDIRRQAATMVG